MWRPGTPDRDLLPVRGFHCRGHRLCRLQAKESSAVSALPGASLSLMQAELQELDLAHPLLGKRQRHRWPCLTGQVQALLPQRLIPGPVNGLSTDGKS